MTGSDSSSSGGSLRSKLGGYSPLARFYRRFRPAWLWRATSPFGKPTSRYVTEQGLIVKRGPFKGMTYTDESVGRANHLSSKLIGSYEPPVTEFLGRQAADHDLFVDLGSGEGYFCVGMALAAQLQVIGYEVNRYESGLAHRIAAANGVKIETRGAVGLDELNSLPEGRLLLLSDIEGLEEDLLDPVAVPRLRDATMIVEAHEQFRPGVSAKLEERFESSHRVEHHSAAQAQPADYPELSGWEPDQAAWAVSDGHLSGQGWMSFVQR